MDKHEDVQELIKIEKQLKEALAYLETLANFGGTIQQARELACKGVQKLKEMNNV